MRWRDDGLVANITARVDLRVNVGERHDVRWVIKSEEVLRESRRIWQELIECKIGRGGEGGIGKGHNKTSKAVTTLNRAEAGVFGLFELANVTQWDPTFGRLLHTTELDRVSSFPPTHQWIGYHHTTPSLEWFNCSYHTPPIKPHMTSSPVSTRSVCNHQLYTSWFLLYTGQPGRRIPYETATTWPHQRVRSLTCENSHKAWHLVTTVSITTTTTTTTVLSGGSISPGYRQYHIARSRDVV